MKDKKQLHTAQLGIYNPGRMSDADLELAFVARQEIFQLLMEGITAESKDSIPQHYLIIGQRGMGKSTLLHRIAVELRKPNHNDQFIPLTFPEEQYNVDRLSKFWLNCLEALADLMDKKGELQLLGNLEKDITETKQKLIKDSEAALAMFDHWCSQLGKRAVLLVDNLNQIFDRLSKKEQHALRATLMNDNAPILVGASSISMDEVSDYGAPFYDAFDMLYLKKLSLLESRRVLANFGRITGNPDFEKSLREKPGRLAAMYQLTGGTPRTLAMLYPLIRDGFSGDVQNDLDALTDSVTPLYKASFEELSDQMQVILDAIAIHWHPMTLEQLRLQTQLKNEQLSPQLKRLVAVGWLVKQESYEARGSAYEISERFFNIWYLMRRSTRRQKRELLCLSKFLESLYGEELEQIGMNAIRLESRHINHAVYKLALAESVHEPKLKSLLQQKGFKELISFGATNPSMLSEYDIPKEFLDDNLETLLEPIKEAFINEDYTSAINLLNKVDQHLDQHPNLMMVRGAIESKLGDDESAIDLYKQAIELCQADIKRKEDVAHWYVELGKLQTTVEKYREAINSFESATQIDAGYDQGYLGLGYVYALYLNEPEKAIEPLKQLAIIGKDSEDSWELLGETFIRLNRLSEAEEALEKVLKFDPSNSNAVFQLVEMLTEGNRSLGRAQKILENAIDHTEETELRAAFFGRLGGVLAFDGDAYEEGLQAFQSAVDLNSKDWRSYYGKGIVLQFNLSRPHEAIVCFKKALEVESKLEIVTLLSYLYVSKLKKYDEARQLLESWSGEKNDVFWALLGRLYLDFFNLPLAAERAFLEQLKPELKTDRTTSFNLVALYRDKLYQVEKAKALFKEGFESKASSDTLALHQALFAMYDKNLGHGLEFLVSALKEIEGDLPEESQDDWWRFGAVAAKLGYGEDVLQVLSNHGYDTILQPYYVAIKAMTVKKPEAYLKSVAAEIREPAKQLYDIMERYNRPGEDVED